MWIFKFRTKGERTEVFLVRALAEASVDHVMGYELDRMTLANTAPLRNKSASRDGADAMAARPALLLAWYDRHRRVLPWRPPHGVPANPYAVWLSEIMLQQTGVKTVGPYFEKFLARWPDVAALAAASREDVLRMWAGLGYYSRARNLHACAVAVVRDHRGSFPDTEQELRRLPGIGPYTAAAIAAIAFNRPTMPVDGNIERVVSRLFAVDVPLPLAKPLIRDLAMTLLGEQVAGHVPSRADGSGVVHLFAEAAGLRLVSARRRMRGTYAGRSGDLSAQGTEEIRRVAARCGFRRLPRRRNSASQAPGEGLARRHDRGAGFGLARRAGR
jgi:endonuclease III